MSPAKHLRIILQQPHVRRQTSPIELLQHLVYCGEGITTVWKRLDIVHVVTHMMARQTKRHNQHKSDTIVTRQISL